MTIKTGICIVANHSIDLDLVFARQYPKGMFSRKVANPINSILTSKGKNSDYF